MRAMKDVKRKREVRIVAVEILNDKNELENIVYKVSMSAVDGDGNPLAKEYFFYSETTDLKEALKMWINRF